MTVILIFFFSHWFLSLFFHTFFLHRYASHQMYTTNKGWERFFYGCTWFFQGSSYLVPRAYGVMHRMHHTYSDTEKDPHSPHFFRDVWSMMVQTRRLYNGFLTGKNKPEPQFTQDYLPVWDRLDRFGDHMLTRSIFMIGYILVYVFFAPAWPFFLLLPVHFLMGPIQGAIVNWCGHKYGYSNFENGDHSKNTTPFGILLMGELFQNNHHRYMHSPNFAKRWFEFDLTYPVMKLLHYTRIIHLKPYAVPLEKKDAALQQVKKVA